MTGEPTLQRLADNDAIWECVLRYSRGLDRLDIDLFRSAYWDNGEFCHGAVNPTFRRSADHFSVIFATSSRRARRCVA